MIRKSKTAALQFGVEAILLSMLLFAESSMGLAFGFLGAGLTNVAVVLRDAETQWMVFLCSAVYLTAFLFLRFNMRKPDHTVESLQRNLAVWLVCGMAIGIVVYAFDYSPSTPALMLLTGAVIGQGTDVRRMFRRGDPNGASANRFVVFILLLFVMLLFVASFGVSDSSRILQYHDRQRWSGPWGNPNIAALLMGTGIVLAAGYIVSSFKLRVSSSNGDRWPWIRAILFLATTAMVRGLLLSYSRGAWLATVVGVGYLGTQVFSFRLSLFSQWIRRNPSVLSAIILSVGILTFWEFRQTEWHPVQRAFSAANLADFSWRNRIAAWEGALQITAEHPWLGTGWNKSESLYDWYYLAPKLSEGGAIELNDFVVLAATLGIPALFCFGIYFWQSLFGGTKLGARGARRGEKEGGHQVRSAECGVRNSVNGEGGSEMEDNKQAELHWLKTTCRAGAIVLAVGFWFDGGLFKLATASTFWILLELGSVAWGNGINNQDAKSPRGAGVQVSGSVSQTE
jgi:O-antigen ligase